MARSTPRKDPPSRAADGFTNYDEFTGLDPARHYVVVDPNDKATWNMYESRGYEAETVRPDGPRAAAALKAKEGNVTSALGGVLMSRPIEWQKQEVDAGQRRADIMANRLAGGALDGETRGATHRLRTDPDRDHHMNESFTEIGA